MKIYVWRFRRWLAKVIDPGVYPYWKKYKQLPVKRDVSDFIDKLDPADIPMLKYLGISDYGKRHRSGVELRDWPLRKYTLEELGIEVDDEAQP